MKRLVLNWLAVKNFDLIGFPTPFTIEMRTLFQELCLERIDWDGELQGSLLKFETLLDELKFLSSVWIPRCYFKSSLVKVALHGFSDASRRAYAAVVYTCSLYSLYVRLVSSKSRVAPLKKQSIPRLELLGTVLLAWECGKSCRRSLISPDTWRNCPGDLNPADIPSCELSVKELSTDTTWWNGTSFLYLPESAWP